MIKNRLIIFTVLLLFVLGSPFAFAEKCRVKVTSAPDGAMFSVNLPALKFGPTPFNFEFERGKTYSLTFTRDGYKPKTIEYRADCKDVFVRLDRESGVDTSVDTGKKGMLQIASNVVSAQVYINGEHRGKIPLTVRLDYGTYEIRVSEPGYGNYVENVRVDKPTVKIKADLVKGGGTTTASSSMLRVSSNVVGAKVYINDELRGKIPLTLKLAYGTYTIRVSEEGYADYEETIRLNRSETTVTAKLDKSARGGTLQINSNVKGAQVYINGDFKGDVPLTVRLEYGRYDIRVTQEGYDDYEETVNLNTNTLRINANLERGRFTRLEIVSNVKNADVYVDDKLVGQTPVNTRVEFGTHDIQVSRDGYEDYFETINARGRELRIEANLERASKISLTVLSNIIGAEVFLNNRKIGKTPLTVQQSTGTYRLRVSLPGSGYEDYSTNLKLRKEDTVVDAVLVSDDVLVVELPLGARVKVDNIAYEINWDKTERNKRQMEVVKIYAPDRKRTQTHDLHIEAYGLVFRKNIRFYKDENKAPVLKLQLALD